MDYYLQNLRTGETIALDPHRTLVGTADHAAVRTEAGPYLAALAVRYPAGWALHGLSHDPDVIYNRLPLGLAQRVTPKRGDLLVVAGERFTVRAPGNAPAPEPPPGDEPPACFAYVRNPDGMEECRAVDHDLLFGRLPGCHVQFNDTRLSRLGALLASHGGGWFVHPLSDRPIARNRKAVTTCTPVEDGDELQVGPLFVRIEIRAADAPTPTDPPDEVPTDVGDGETPEPAPAPDLVALEIAARALESWLRAHPPAAAPARAEGLAGWLETQRDRLSDRLRRFWYDTPETTAARAMRTAGRPAEAFAVLDRAVRARPDSPELLRELFRLYEAVGLTDLCYRPLRQIEKLAAARGTSDPWVLEALARLCERMSRTKPEMFDRAIRYWDKLEAATGVSRSRERAEAMANRALRDGGYARKLGGAED